MNHLRLSLLATLLACLFAPPSNASTKHVACYYASWKVADLAPEDVDVSICTHVKYAFLGVNPDGTLRLDTSDDIIRRLGTLKERNPNVKLIFSVGGWNEGSAIFSPVAADANKRATFAQSALQYLQTYNYDGIDIDWEYPGQREGSSPDDKKNYIELLRTLKQELSNGGYVLSTAVSPDPVADSYDVPALSDTVDLINVMSYTFHSAGGGKTGQNSPLYASSSDSDWQKSHSNVHASISNWINAGAALEKTLLGMAFYGKSYTLSDPNNHGVGAPVSGPGLGNGDQTYKQLCQLKGWTQVWDEEQYNPYMYNGDQWIGYDDPKSISFKVSYCNHKGIGGVLVWAVNLDDTEGICGVKNALLEEIRKNLE